MRFPYKLIMIMPVAVQAVSRQALENIVRRSNIFPAELVKLSNNPPGTLTHYGTQIILNETMKVRLDNIQGSLALVFWFLVDNRTGGLISTSSNVANPPIGNSWNFAQSLQHMGLRKI